VREATREGQDENDRVIVSNVVKDDDGVECGEDIVATRVITLSMRYAK
jgi:hypothetical protein